MILKTLKLDKRRALVAILSCLGVVLLMTLFEGIASAATLQEIKQRGYMIVATEDDYPPFEFVKDGVGMGLDHGCSRRRRHSKFGSRFYLGRASLPASRRVNTM